MGSSLTPSRRVFKVALGLLVGALAITLACAIGVPARAWADEPQVGEDRPADATRTQVLPDADAGTAGGAAGSPDALPGTVPDSAEADAASETQSVAAPEEDPAEGCALAEPAAELLADADAEPVPEPARGTDSEPEAQIGGEPLPEPGEELGDVDGVPEPAGKADEAADEAAGNEADSPTEPVQENPLVDAEDHSSQAPANDSEEGLLEDQEGADALKADAAVEGEGAEGGQAQDADKAAQLAKAVSLPKASSIAKALRATLGDAGERLHIALVAQATTKRTVADGIYLVSPSASTAKMLQSAGASTKAGAEANVAADLNAIHQRWTLAYAKNGLYSLKNVSSGKYLAVKGGKAAVHVPVVQNAQANAASQQWRVVKYANGYRLVSALSPWLAVSIGLDGSSGRVVPVRGATGQVWKLQAVKRTLADGVYAVSNKKSGKVLTVEGGSVSSGANVQQNAADGSLSQVFSVKYNTATGYYVLTAPSGSSLDVAGGSAKSGANVQVAATNGKASQNWSIVKASNGVYRLVSSVSGKALDITGASTANGANVQVYAGNDSACQQFTFKKLGSWLPEGAYRILASSNHATALAAAGTGASGANVALAAASQDTSQRFYIRPSGSGAYTIQSALSGTYLGLASSSAGANVRQGTAHQAWVPTITAQGITFVSKGSGSLALAISGKTGSAGANVQGSKPNTAAAQRFVLQPTGLLADGIYTIASAIDANFVWDTVYQSKDSGLRLQVCKTNGTIAQQYRLTQVGTGAYRIAGMVSGKPVQAMSPTAASGQIQQQAPTSSTSQQWHLAMNSDGSISILSAASGDTTAMTLASSKPANFTMVDTRKRSSAATQHWRLTPSKGSVQAYDNLSITLDQMVSWQFDSPYNAQFTHAQMRSALDPSAQESYQFIDLREKAGATADQINAFVASRGVAGGKIAGQGQAFVDGAAKHGLNELFLLSLAALESGWGTSDLASGYTYGGGTIDGTYYPEGTYYNFFGIGAYDTSPLSGGRKAAIINGWSSPAKAIEGAAQWIASNYVYRSQYAQPTLYAMRWDYAYSDANKERSWHQYSTGTTWTSLVSGVLASAYNNIDVSAPKIYLTPKYK